MKNTGKSRSTHKQPAQFRIAWFAGVDLKILARTPSEIGFYNALGAAVILISCASGFAAALAIGYMLQKPPGDVWWIGAAWALILTFGIERLILQVTTNKRLWLLLILVPRVVLSLALAVQLGEPLVLRIHQGEINNYLSEKRVEATRTAEEEAREFFAPEIKTETGKLVAIGEQETRLTQRIVESSDPILVNRYRSRLAEIESLNQDRMPRIEAELEHLRHERNDQIHERESEIGGGSGLAARESALTALANEHSEVAVGIWVLRILFLCIDLLPITAKVLRILTVDSPYEVLAAAERRRDGIPAKQLEAEARVTETQVEERMRVDIEVARAEANVYGAQRMDEIDDDDGDGEDASGREAPVTRKAPSGPEAAPQSKAPVPALSLSRLVKGMEAHESRPAPVPEGLRRGAMTGLASIMGLAALMVVRSLALGHAVGGIWLVAICLLFVLGLMTYTHGFRTAPAWALRGTLATFYAGLLLPIVVVIINA